MTTSPTGRIISTVPNYQQLPKHSPLTQRDILAGLRRDPGKSWFHYHWLHFVACEEARIEKRTFSWINIHEHF